MIMQFIQHQMIAINVNLCIQNWRIYVHRSKLNRTSSKLAVRIEIRV